MIVDGEDHRTDHWSRANSGMLNFIFRNYVGLYANYFHRVCSSCFVIRYFVNENKQILILENRRRIP